MSPNIFQIAATSVAGLHAELGQEEEKLLAGIASVLVDEQRWQDALALRASFRGGRCREYQMLFALIS